MDAFDPSSYLEIFEAVARRHGLSGLDLASTDVGPVRIWTRESTNKKSATVFISAGMHGDEPAGPLAVLEWLKQCELSPTINWVLTPALNPTGLKKRTRDNCDCIDLNRDFHRCQSEEVCALMRWWESHGTHCDFHFSLHEDWEAEGFYLYAINTSDQRCFGKEILQRLKAFARLQTHGPVDDHLLAAPGLIAHPPQPDEPEGWPEAIWLVHRGPTRSYTFEAPGAFSPDERINVLRQALTIALDEVEKETSSILQD